MPSSLLIEECTPGLTQKNLNFEDDMGKLWFSVENQDHYDDGSYGGYLSPKNALALGEWLVETYG